MDPFIVDSQARVTTAGIRRLRRGHPWVYSGDLESEPSASGPAPAIVQVVDPAGNFLGYAFYSRQSQIRLRLFSREPDIAIDTLLRTRIARSIERRRSFAGSACRLIFGEGDLLPGLIVDRYGEYLVLQTLSSGADALKPWIVDVLNEQLRPTGILERNDVKARRLEGLEEIQGVLSGTVPDQVEITEFDTRFLIDLRRGQKTGFFLDQSQNRLAARKYVSGHALDCFTNTGAFALHFARCCESVLAVDISSDSLDQACRNRDLNGISNVDFQLGNVFDYLRELESAGRTFDVVCLDPPAFAKNRKSLAGARTGYKEINLRALKLLRPEGVLITSSCSYHMSESDFFEVLCDAAHDSHRYIQVLEKRGQSNDHPVLAGMPETHYLKCFFLRAL